MEINYIEKEVYGDNYTIFKAQMQLNKYLPEFITPPSYSTIKETEDFLKQIAVTLVINLKERFDGDGILQNFSIFDTKIIRKTTNDKIGTFGNEQLDQLIYHYDKLIDANETRKEWRLAKLSLRNMSINNQSEEEVWLDFIETYGKRYFNISKLVSIMFTFPMSTAPCERGFSQLSLIKTKYRNCLSKN